jgi:AcrR family transcriptional regulator
MTVVARRPNRRGEGDRLRGEILAAAGTILAREGSDDAVTLRAIAREAGITAPAIYAHFSDRWEILRTVVVATFAELAKVMAAATVGLDDPVDRLRAVCHAYLDFAAAQPHHYRVLFERHRTAPVNLRGTGEPNTDVRSMVGADAFGVLLDATIACITAGVSRATEPVDATNQIWIGLHGQATLQASMPWHPWPANRGRFADHIIDLLAELGPTKPTPTRRR